MDKSNKSQRQTCDQDMSSTFYPVASEKSMDEILGPTTQKPGKWKNQKKSYLCKERVYCSTVFGRIHYVHVSNVTYFRFAMHFICSRQYLKSINQGSDHPSFIGAAKYSTILDTKQGAVWSSWPSAMIERCTKHASLAFRIWFLLEVGVKQSAANIDGRNRAKVRIKCHRTTSIRTASARHWHSLVIKYMGHRTNAFTASNKCLKIATKKHSRACVKACMRLTLQTCTAI